MLNALRQRAERRRCSAALLAGLSAQARLPAFFAEFGVADTVDGRFDLLALHAWLVLDRLATQQLQDLAQALVDGLFVQFDEALRQQGAGDIGMSRRMTKMADAFYGRLKAYGEAPDDAAMAAAIARNLFRGDTEKLEQARRLAIYVSAARRHLAATDLSQGRVEFGPIPSP